MDNKDRDRELDLVVYFKQKEPFGEFIECKATDRGAIRFVADIKLHERPAIKGIY